MEKIVLSAVYFPSVEYMHLLLKSDEFFIECKEHYQRQTARNRCVIYGPNGAHRLSVPVHHFAGLKQPIRDVKIDYALPWQANHMRSLEAAYNKSPFFMYYKEELLVALEYRDVFLFDMNIRLLELILRLLKFEKEVRYTADYQKVLLGALDARALRKPETVLQSGMFPRYCQVFEPAHGFIPNLSCLDLLFNKGNDALNYLRNLALD